MRYIIKFITLQWGDCWKLENEKILVDFFWNITSCINRFVLQPYDPKFVTGTHLTKQCLLWSSHSESVFRKAMNAMLTLSDFFFTPSTTHAVHAFHFSHRIFSTAFKLYMELGITNGKNIPYWRNSNYTF